MALPGCFLLLPRLVFPVVSGYSLKNYNLIGILSKISGILADNKIGIFAVSTYNTDYILVKKENFEKALRVLGEAGYEIV